MARRSERVHLFDGTRGRRLSEGRALSDGRARSEELVASAADPLDPTGTLGELSLILTSARTLAVVLEDIVALAKTRIPGADEVSMTMIEDGRPSTVASTGHLAIEMDERQYASGWGPCLDAAHAGQMLAVEDMSTETRWPEFRDRGQELGLGSSLSTPLPVQQHLSGALNAYAGRPRSFDSASRQLAQSFAGHAALALAQAYRFTRATDQAESLLEAMRSRAVIEQAKGILMAARKLDADQAFDVLVRGSQAGHVKLRQLAVEIVTQASGHPVRMPDVEPRSS
jgi:GAF domain-containing protein